MVYKVGHFWKSVFTIIGATIGFILSSFAIGMIAWFVFKFLNKPFGFENLPVAVNIGIFGVAGFLVLLLLILIPQKIRWFLPNHYERGRQISEYEEYERQWQEQESQYDGYYEQGPTEDEM